MIPKRLQFYKPNYQVVGGCTYGSFGTLASACLNVTSSKRQLVSAWAFLPGSAVESATCLSGLASLPRQSVHDGPLLFLHYVSSCTAPSPALGAPRFFCLTAPGTSATSGDTCRTAARCGWSWPPPLRSLATVKPRRRFPWSCRLGLYERRRFCLVAFGSILVFNSDER